jgi:hypothetical protein
MTPIVYIGNLTVAVYERRNKKWDIEIVEVTTTVDRAR